MKFLIIGASGRTGQALTAMALSHGHQVTAFGRRRPDNFPDNFGFVKGDPQEAKELLIAISGHDAVISCLGQRSSHDAGLLARSASAAVSTMQNSHHRRYIVVSQGLLFPSANPIVLLLRSILKRHVADSQEMESIVRGSNLDWTIVRPPRLKMGARSRGFKIAIGDQPTGSWSMAYDDLGACLLEIAEGKSCIGKIVGVTSA